MGVTGANVGLGYYTTLHLAQKGSKVIMACRSAGKCENAATAIRASNPDADVVPLIVDLGSLKSVEDFALEVTTKFDRLDHIVFNAGFGEFSGSVTVDGLEKVFAVNHVGHFKLYKDLESLIEKTSQSADVRLVHVASNAHFSGHVPATSEADLNDMAKYTNIMRPYC